MRRIRGFLPHLTVTTCAILLASPLAAQSGTTAVISGTVMGAGEVPIPGSLVTLTSLDRSGSYETSAGGDGTFRFALVAPGSYELRAEALGYRPVIARTLTVTGGGRASVVLPMAQAPPPVLTVDTIAIGAAGASRFVAGGLQLGARELGGLPHRYEDLTSLAVLTPGLDASLGSQGLPGAMTFRVVDGVPVYRAPHPVARAEQLSGAALPRSALSGVRVLTTAPGVEWGGSTGGRVASTTTTATAAEGLAEVAWSGEPLWSSSELDFSTPSLMSFQGSGLATVPVSPGVSQIVISGDALRQETPLAQRITEPVATGLAGLDPDLIATLSEPSVERYSRFSGMARFDAQPGVTSHLFVRGAAGYAKREFDGAGPVTLAPEAALPEETIEYSFAGGYIREFSPGRSFEFRGGVSGGIRTFDPASVGMPAAFLAASGSSLGFLAAGIGESSRTDLVLSPVLHFGVGTGVLKVGTSARASKHSMLHTQPAGFLFSDGPALVAGQGYAASVTAPEASFSTQEFGAFVQLDSEPIRGLRTSIGTRLDYERIPGGNATLNTPWLQASGLRNDEYPGGFVQLGLVGSVTWAPTASTEIFSVVSVQHGDVDSRVLGEFFSRDEGATSSIFAGSGVAWPDGAVPAGPSTLPTITLLGPDTRAPRSMQANAGLVRQLVAGWSVHMSGAFRRTDFLMRRRNLNLPLMPQAVDPDGRGVYGTVQQDGSLVTATGTDARRFDGFNAVWALDPDGQSEYVGATGGLEYAGERTDLIVTYTYSETTDNWIGAALGTPDSGLSPLLPEAGWSEGVSDFDIPHRVTAAATARVSLATLSAVYRFRSGYPFTPRYRAGVDANGDGSLRNDVAFVDASVVDPLLSEWPCLDSQLSGFAVRNSCRGPSAHSVDVRIRFRLGRLAGRDASLVLDGFNLVESRDGVVDDALLLVDPTGSITTSSGVVTIPFVLNPDFGRVIYPSTRGRMVRIGFRIG
ncbi:MAG: carboxypeptidase-like regulatory domain-containing protein [Gemmatimonadota bacterium]|nr:carboxypeptidase-like regulatory domain-containing protein [Gemmatimonadota bacterium]